MKRATISTPTNAWVADTTRPYRSCTYLLHGEKTPQYERLYLVEEGVHRGHAVQRHQVQLELPDSPLSTELLVVALRPLLWRRDEKQNVCIIYSTAAGVICRTSKWR